MNLNRIGFAARLFLVSATCLAWATGAPSAELNFEAGLGGATRHAATQRDDSLVEIARTYDVGYNAIISANPGVDPFVPDVGTVVVIPTHWILPDVARPEGIVINLAEYRLYRFPLRPKGRIQTYPIGIGDEGWETPLGAYRIIERIRDPAWHVPDSIRREKPDLPSVVPPGPDNPLGNRALRLSIGTVLIHGTDRPYGIGRRVSHGCIHLYPEDILKLFDDVPVGTRVEIVRQPIKVAARSGRVYVEVHGEEGDELGAEAQKVLLRRRLLDLVDPVKVDRAIREKWGIPVDVTKD